jgi:hypothetical protein
MRDHRELASNRDFGFADPASFGDPHAPGFEHGSFSNACQQNACRLEEIPSQHLITAFRDPSCPVDFTGCIATACQTDITSDAARSLEARWIVNGRQITKRSDRTYAGHFHEAALFSLEQGTLPSLGSPPIVPTITVVRARRHDSHLIRVDMLWPRLRCSRPTRSYAESGWKATIWRNGRRLHAIEVITSRGRGQPERLAFPCSPESTYLASTHCCHSFLRRRAK